MYCLHSLDSYHGRLLLDDLYWLERVHVCFFVLCVYVFNTLVGGGAVVFPLLALVFCVYY